MTYTEVKLFFQDFAQDGGYHFFHNIEHLTEKKSDTDLSVYSVVMDEPRGRRMWNGNLYDQPSYGFWVLKKVEKGDWEGEDVAYDGAKAIMNALVSLMDEQREEEDGVLRNYDPGSVDYMKAGPETIERLFGIYVTFGVTEPA